MPPKDTAFRVLVVGAGYTGQRLLAALPQATTAAVGRSRPESPAGRFIVADLDEDGDPLPVQFTAEYAVVFTVPPASDAGSRVARLLRRLPAPPGRFVYLSTTGVYGDRGGALVDETATPHPETPRARRRLAVETMLAERCGAAGTELVILRVPGIYGPGRLGLDAIARGRPVIAEEDAHPGNRIHVDDLVACCLAASDSRRPAGTYNVGDGDHRSGTWFTLEVARQAGLPPPPAVSREAAEELFPAERLSFLRESRRLDVTRMREVLRPELRYGDPVAGIAASLQAERGG